MKRLALVFSIGLAVIISLKRDEHPVITTSSSPSSIALAKHLRSKGFVKYSVHWCPYCDKQNQLFGKEAADLLIDVECELNQETKKLCQEKGIIGYPSWEINGVIQAGIKSLDELAELSNFKIKKAFK